MLPTIKLGSWPKGVDQVSIESALLTDARGRTVAVRDAQNVDIDRSGRPSRRDGRAVTKTQSGLQNLWSCELGAFAQVGAELYDVTAGAPTPLAALNSADPCGYTVLNDTVVVANRTTLLSVREGAATPLGVSDAPAPLLMRSIAGGLYAGRYSVAFSFLRGSLEGGLSALSTIQLTEGDGMHLSRLPVASDATALRVYRTTTNGETLYHVTDLPIGLTEFLIGNGPLGDDASTQYLRRMPPGEIVARWRGRLLIGRGRSMYVSRPMNYGLYSPRHGFVQFAQRGTMIAPVQTGVFVGTQSGVVFLRGRRPSEWQQESTGALPPVPGSAIEIDGGLLDPQLQLGGNSHALWLAPNGYVIGSNDGKIVELQADRISQVVALQGRSVVHNRRVVTVVA